MFANAVGLLPASVNRVTPGMEHSVLTLTNVLILLITVILVEQCVLMLWALLPSRLSQVCQEGDTVN